MRLEQASQMGSNKLSDQIVQRQFEKTSTAPKATAVQQSSQHILEDQMPDSSKDINPAEKHLVRKLDCRIMPILWAMYFLNILDRTALPQARLNTLEKDLGLKDVEYNTAVAVLFADYLLMQVPSNMFLTRTRPSIYLPICMVAWAVMTACTALAKNYSGLLATCFCLGLTEAGYYPAALYLLSSFYTRKELTVRIALLYTGLVIATSCSGLIAAAVFATLDMAHGLAGWRWLYIVEGVVTFGIAVLSFFLLPDDPAETHWLTQEERELVVARIRRDTVGLKARGTLWAGLKQACTDPKTWLFCLMFNLNISTCSFVNFFPTIVKSLGFKSNTTALLLTAPPYLLSGLAGIPLAWSSGRFNERTWHITAGLVLAVVGFVISCSNTSIGARYTATFLYTTGAYSVTSIILSWIPATLGQTAEKKAIALSLVNVFGNTAYIYGAYLWPKSDSPRFMNGFSSMVAFAAGAIACVWAMKFWLTYLNRKLKKQGDEARRCIHTDGKAKGRNIP